MPKPSPTKCPIMAAKVHTLMTDSSIASFKHITLFLVRAVLSSVQANIPYQLRLNLIAHPSLKFLQPLLDVDLESNNLFQRPLHTSMELFSDPARILPHT